MSNPRYLLYRCHNCRRLITKLEIIKRWDKMLAAGQTGGTICSCGSNHIAPTNARWWQELLYPKIWWLWFKEVRGKKDKLDPEIYG